MQITDKVIREERECLNCGEVSEGLFCNNCGQSMETPQRITMKTFGKGVAMSFARLTPVTSTTPEAEAGGVSAPGQPG